MINTADNKNRGISLIELIVVIAIMAVLIGVLSPMFVKFIDKSRKSRDIHTADEIARAINVAFIENQGAYEAFQKFGVTPGYSAPRVKVKATYHGVVRQYWVYLVASSGKQDTNTSSNCFNGSGPGLFKRFKDGSDGFYGTINRELGLSVTEMNPSMVPQHKVNGISYKNPEKYADRYRIVKREDNGMMEIWVAQPDPMGGYPAYRVWPEPDDEYTM